MHFFILVLVLCLFIFLFALYFLSHDDFVLLRRDISVDSLFNITFLMVPISLLFARVLYVIVAPTSNFLNPLYFLLFPYFPGLSLTGGVLGTGAFLFTIFKIKKMPTGRLLDLFMLSFLTCMPIGALGYFILSGINILSFAVLFTIFSYIGIFSFFSFFLLPRLLKGRLGEGSMSLLFLIAFCLISILEKIPAGKSYLGLESILLVFVLISSTFFYIKKENVISKLKK